MRLFGQLFDAPAEIVIAHGRVVLAAFSLAAITIDPTQPPHLAPLVAATLMMYAAYAVVLLAALHRRFIHNVNALLVHTIDLAVVALLLVLTEGFSSPFLVFFTFALLAASLRWDWKGIAATMVVLVLIAGMIAALDSIDGQMPNLHQTVIRGAYLIATGTILTYASAHREHERNRLAKLAHSPTAVSNGTVSGPHWPKRSSRQSPRWRHPVPSSCGRMIIADSRLPYGMVEKFEMTEASAESVGHHGRAGDGWTDILANLARSGSAQSCQWLGPLDAGRAARRARVETSDHGFFVFAVPRSGGEWASFHPREHTPKRRSPADHPHHRGSRWHGIGSSDLSGTRDTRRGDARACRHHA